MEEKNIKELELMESNELNDKELENVAGGADLISQDLASGKRISEIVNPGQDTKPQDLNVDFSKGKVGGTIGSKREDEIKPNYLNPVRH